jgi:tol-pal system protein YbgF
MRGFAICAGLSLLALSALGPVAHAQQDNRDIRPLLDRMDRLERDINLLQRQVYRGGTGSAPQPAAPIDSGNAALNFEIRMGRIEDQMRTMTGQIEETSYKIEQLRQNLEKLQSDIEVRFNQMQGGGQLQTGAAPVGTPPPLPPQIPETPRNAPIQLRPPAASADSANLAGQPGTLGMLRVPQGQEAPGAASASPVTSSGARTAAAPGTAGDALGNGSAQDQYNNAFGLLRQARYEEAEQALRAFVQRNPKDPLAAAAEYWLGETFYVRKDYTNAAAVFAEGYEKYPKSPKGADFLLKLGMSFSNAGQKENACRAFLRLDRDYPQAPSEIRDRSGTEKKRLGCPA